MKHFHIVLKNGTTFDYRVADMRLEGNFIIITTISGELAGINQDEVATFSLKEMKEEA